MYVRDSYLDGGKAPCLQPGTDYVFGFWYDGWKETPPITKDEVESLKDQMDTDKIKEREEFASQFKESPWSIYLENIQYLIGIAFILFFSIFFADFS